MVAANPVRHWRQPWVKELDALGEEMSGGGRQSNEKSRDGAIGRRRAGAG
jgi:hypothetical protein